MKLRRILLASVAATILASAPVLAQDEPAAGTSGGGTFASMPIGSHVMFAGLIFVVTVGGLVLLDDDENEGSSPTPTPAPPPTTTTTTTTT